MYKLTAKLVRFQKTHREATWIQKIAGHVYNLDELHKFENCAFLLMQIELFF